MSDIEIVIKLDEDVKNRLCFGVTYTQDIQKLCEALNNGTILPKGHGKLKDVDKLTLDVFECEEENWMWTNITKSGYSKEQVESLETVLEADKSIEEVTEDEKPNN